MGSKQSTSLRVDFPLYTALANLAKVRGTTITTQVERAIRAHLEEHAAERAVPLIKRVVGEAAGEAVEPRLARVEARLGALLGRLALLDATVLYTALEGKSRDYWTKAREWGIKHVEHEFRDTVAQPPTDAGEVQELRSRVKALQAELSASEGARQELRSVCQRQDAELHRLRADLDYMQQLQGWEQARDDWTIAIYESQGFSLRRKSLDELRQQYEERFPRPRRRD